MKSRSIYSRILAAGLGLLLAGSMSVYAEGTGPAAAGTNGGVIYAPGVIPANANGGDTVQNAGSQQKTEVTQAGTAAQPSAASAASSQTVSGKSSAAPAAQAAAASSGHRKTAEELQAAMAAVPAGPAKAEWGTFFLGNNLPPRNDEDEAYLRSFHAYAMVPTEQKIAYLTFDEGYENGYTPAILDVLAKHHVKAAFFCTGSFIKESPELVRRFAEEGHIIANHTLTHPDMMKVGTWEEFSRQLLSVEDRVKAITGKDMPRYYRPPAGAYSEAQLRMADAMGFRTVFWSVAYKDWDTKAQPTHEKAMNYLTTRIHPGAIILLHAVSKTNAEIMDQLLTTWEQMGYTFKTLDELPDGLSE